MGFREERLRLLPGIRRARDFRLHTTGGDRLVDLWQYGGRALLGHKPPGMLREFKNAAERGLFAPLPSRLEGRFFRALGTLLPGKDFLAWPDEAALRRALGAAGYPPEAPFPDPAGPPLDGGGTPPLWRPFSALPPPELCLPVLPVPLAGAPWVLALDRGKFRRGDFLAGADEAGGGAGGMVAGGPLSPAVLAAAARAVHDLIAAPERRRGAFPKIRRALRAGAWRERGIYLSRPALPEEEDWSGTFRRFLEAGFLIPPDRTEPLVVPGTLSPGEESRLAALLAE